MQQRWLMITIMEGECPLGPANQIFGFMSHGTIKIERNLFEDFFFTNVSFEHFFSFSCSPWNQKSKIIHKLKTKLNKISLTISSSLHLLSSSSDILFSCFLKYFLFAACRLNHVYANDLTCGNSASMNGWNSSWK